jgi:hypothetical protein
MVKKYPPRLINAIVSVMLRKSSELLESYEKAKENAVKNLQET